MTILGRDIHTKNEVWIGKDTRLRGIYCIGKTGTGKTTLVSNLVVDSMQQGVGLCLIDPHGDVTEEVVKRCPENRVKDIILLDPMDTDFPFPLNLFSCRNPNDPKIAEATVEQIIQVFSKVFGMSSETPRLNQYVRNIAYALIGTQYTMCEIPVLLQEKAFRAKVLTHERNTAFWRSYDKLRESEQLDRSESTLDRIDSLISNSIIRNIVGQSKTIDFKKVMDDGKILLVKLNRSYMDMTRLLGSVIIGQLLMAALSRRENRKPFHVYIDEFQLSSTPAASELLSEARKYGIATMVCHQYRDQLDEKNQGGTLNTGTLISFGLIGKDADELSMEFNSAPNAADEREKTLPGKVLESLWQHPMKEIKDFDRQFVRKFLQAKAMQVKEIHTTDSPDMYKREQWTKEFPQFAFDDEPVEFHPQDLVEFLDVLETFLFDTMLSRDIDMEEKNNVLLAWTYCCSGAYSPDHKHRHDYSLSETSFRMPEYTEEINRKAKVRFERFQEELLRTAVILKLHPIYVYPNTKPNENTTQRTFADKRNEIANELVALSQTIGRAKVKINHGEYTIDTIWPGKVQSDPKKRTQVVEQTRSNYCTPRHEVEAEIRERQRTDNDQPMTKRRGWV